MSSPRVLNLSQGKLSGPRPDRYISTVATACYRPMILPFSPITKASSIHHLDHSLVDLYFFIHHLLMLNEIYRRKLKNKNCLISALFHWKRQCFSVCLVWPVDLGPKDFLIKVVQFKSFSFLASRTNFTEPIFQKKAFNFWSVS
jgi:hypothetical protein